jgi:metal-responsive CopG/Arc/MetJ family transcriptional regulator
MAASKIAITIDDNTLKRLDILVRAKFFPNRSKAIQEAVAEKLMRIEKSRLAEVKISQIRILSTQRIGNKIAKATDEELALIIDGLNEIIGG